MYVVQELRVLLFNVQKEEGLEFMTNIICRSLLYLLTRCWPMAERWKPLCLENDRIIHLLQG